jgi:hypothetical protein
MLITTIVIAQLLNDSANHSSFPANFISLFCRIGARDPWRKEEKKHFNLHFF